MAFDSDNYDVPPKYNPKAVTRWLSSNGAAPKYVELALLEAYAAGAREPRAILAIREAAHTSVEMALEKMRARALKAEAQVRECLARETEVGTSPRKPASSYDVYSPKQHATEMAASRYAREQDITIGYACEELGMGYSMSITIRELTIALSAAYDAGKSTK